MSETNESKGMASGIGETLKEIKQFIFKIIGIVLSVCIFLSNYPAIPFYAILAVELLQTYSTNENSTTYG